MPPESSSTIRLILPYHLRTLANITNSELHLPVPVPITISTLLTALETHYPTLRGTLRDHTTLKRRPLIRFFACNQDLSQDSPDTPLPEKITSGAEPFYIIGAIAGG